MTEKAYGKHPANKAHTAVAARKADTDITTPDLFEDLSHGNPHKHGLELLMPLDGEDDLEVLL